ncbi:unnamed protein product [Withania somnifera]
MWLQAEDFIDMIKGWWQSYIIQGTPKDISKWNREVYGNIETQRAKALLELGNLDQVAELKPLSPEEKKQSLNLKLQLQQIATAEEISWRQKSKCLWLKEGGKNTKFIQRMANSHRRGNSIDSLRIGDELIEDKERIKDGILGYYQQIYKETESWRPSAVFENLFTLSTNENEELELPLTELEIFDALIACAPDKTPCPDGYTMAFFQKS